MKSQIERYQTFNLLIDMSLENFSLEDRELFRDIFLSGLHMRDIAKKYKKSFSYIKDVKERCLDKLRQDKLFRKLVRKYYAESR